MSSDQKHALYLSKDGEIKLFHADDVKEAKDSGWAEPEFPKSNGAQWNAQADLAAQDAAASLSKPKPAKAKAKSKK